MIPERRFVPIEQVNHTADVACIVRGRTLEELFENAALALMGYLVDPASVEPRESEKVAIEASDLEECLIEWLQEILFRVDVRRRLFSRFEVHAAGPGGVSATAFGEACDSGRHVLLREIKAATYHGLKIERSDSSAGPLYQARLVFDI